MHFPFGLRPAFMLKETKVVVATRQAFEPRKQANHKKAGFLTVENSMQLAAGLFNPVTQKE